MPPATPQHSHEVSDEEDGGDMMDNVSYKLPSESILDISIMDCDLISLPYPVEKTVNGANRKCAQKKHNMTSREDVEESLTEPTPFKKVIDERGKR